jgi:DNA-binding MarR family transcriptional regulator
MSTIMSKSGDKVNQSSNPAPASEEESLLDLVHSVMHRYRSQQYQVVRDGPSAITHMESKVLGYYQREPGNTQADLVRDSGHDKAQLARLINGLRVRGLLVGEASASDARRVTLKLTAAGQALLKTLERQTRSLHAQAIAGLSESEQRLLLALMRRVKANLTPEN